jgi:prepilin-type N-terminal cleavage/methylation domain-containing protein/prepilin-type processing-associated H-X9-DG protein
MRCPRTAFTLVELLVVIAVIAILAALLLPALSRAKERSRQSYCASSLRQIVLGALMYADEHDDRFPAQPGGDGVSVLMDGGDGRNYYDLLMPYLSDPQVWLCPATKQGPGRLMSYHMNGLISTTNGLSAGAIRQPSNTLLLEESGQTRWDGAMLRPNQMGQYQYGRPQINHSRGGNVPFVDGHVKWYSDSQWNSNYFSEIP